MKKTIALLVFGLMLFGCVNTEKKPSVTNPVPVPGFDVNETVVEGSTMPVSGSDTPDTEATVESGMPVPGLETNETLAYS